MHRPWMLLALVTSIVGCGSDDTGASNAGPSDASAADASTSDADDASSQDGSTEDGNVSSDAPLDTSWPESGSDAPGDAPTDGAGDAPSDSPVESAPDAGPPMFLMSVDHEASPSRLLKIDLQTGLGTVVCNLPSSVDGINYHSTTFSREGKLFASNYQDATIDLIDPCTCDVTTIGPTGAGAIPGITANKTLGLYGIDTTQDVLLDVSVFTGAATVIGPLGSDFTTAGATWSDAMNVGDGGLYGLNGATSQLYEIDPSTGAATPTVTVTGVTIGSVGIELHPFDGELYICTTDAVLYRVDPGTGAATAVGTGMGHVGSCNNLAAPWKQVPCLAH